MAIDVKAHHRRILNLAAEDNPNNARVDLYKKKLGYRDSLAEGWIEELPNFGGSGFYFRITPAGTAALDRPKVRSVTQSSRLATPKPRLAALPPRLS